MKDKLRTFIKSFGFLTAQEVDTIVEHTIVRHFLKGTRLLAEGQVATHCYAVIEGCVREYHLVDGLEKTTDFYTEGQPINAFSSYTNQTPARHYLECTEDCVLTVGTEALEQEMCRRIPRLEQFIRQEVERHSGALQDRLAAFMISTPEQRFVELMETRPELLQRVPQHQIASYIGVTPESFSRIKRRLLKKV